MNLSAVSDLRSLRNYLLQYSHSEAITVHWSLMQICTHCAQTILCAMTGYPKLKPRIIRNTIGPWVLAWFFYRNRMQHNLQADLEGAAAIEVQHRPALEILIQVIDQFLAYEGQLQPHFVFGNLTKAQYDRYFTLHIQDHFSEVNFRTES